MNPFRTLPPSFYARPVDEVARDLLGRYLVREPSARAAGGGRRRLVLRLVETEAYLGAADRASHAWAGRRTARNASLYLPPGHAYVYFIYGMHYCLNAVCGTAPSGGAVLFRAGVAVEGREEMGANRGLDRPPRPGDLAGGPGKLTRALGLDRGFDGVPLTAKGPEGLRITAGEPAAPEEIATGPRVGIDYAGEAAAWPLRFALRGHPEVSRPRL